MNDRRGYCLKGCWGATVTLLSLISWSHAADMTFDANIIINSNLAAAAVSYAGYFDGKGYFRDKVGIGVEDPDDALEVNGDGRFNAVVLNAPAGDIPMGSFTNSP